MEQYFAGAMFVLSKQTLRRIIRHIISPHQPGQGTFGGIITIQHTTWRLPICLTWE
jgi:hypothetical protein